MKLNLINLNQDMNNPAIQRREFRTQHEIEFLKPEPRDEQSSNSKKIIPNSKMKLNLLNVNQEMNNIAIQKKRIPNSKMELIS
jgi:hypothetical protein